MFRAATVLVSCCLLATVVGTPTAPAQEPDPEKAKVLIVTGFDVAVHKWRDTTHHTAAVLEETGMFDVKICEDIGIFESSRLGEYDAIVLNYGFWTAPDPTPEGKDGLLNYVREGKGVVALHFACSSFQDWPEYGQLLGRVWKKGQGGHGPRGKFLVNIVDADHPVTQTLTDFQADDELYAKLSGDVDIQVLASAQSDWSGQVEPIVFVKPYGEGRVVHNVLGHDIVARENESFEKLLVQGVAWAVHGDEAAN
jgi:type 1 glutamine amidotransferase